MEILIIVNIFILLWVAYSVSSKLQNIIQGQEILYKDIQELYVRLEDIESKH